MTIVVAVTDNPEGRHALQAAIDEAERLGTDLVAVNLGLVALDPAVLSPEMTVVNRVGREDRDLVDVVLDEIDERKATRLVLGIRRRSAVGKLVLGSITQRLLLNSPISVLAVKPPGGGPR